MIVTGIAALLPVAVLAARGARGLDVYGWMGSLGTYGFIVAYGLTCLALPRYLRNHGVCRPGARIIPWLTCFVMLLALAGNLYPVPEGAYGKLPLIFLAYLALGLLWFFWSSKRNQGSELPGTRSADWRFSIRQSGDWRSRFHPHNPPKNQKFLLSANVPTNCVQTLTELAGVYLFVTAL